MGFFFPGYTKNINIGTGDMVGAYLSCCIERYIYLQRWFFSANL